VPKHCGGSFVFAGKEIDAAGAGAFSGAIFESDSVDGNTHRQFRAGSQKSDLRFVSHSNAFIAKSGVGCGVGLECNFALSLATRCNPMISLHGL